MLTAGMKYEITGKGNIYTICILDTCTHLNHISGEINRERHLLGGYLITKNR